MYCMQFKMVKHLLGSYHLSFYFFSLLEMEYNQPYQKNQNKTYRNKKEVEEKFIHMSTPGYSATYVATQFTALLVS